MYHNSQNFHYSNHIFLSLGVNTHNIRGTKTGVFIGVIYDETSEYWSSTHDRVNGYGLTGCNRAMFANRISYTFDFKGPSYAVDSACSSSLFALSQAVYAIRNGHCESAVVGGVNLMLKPLNSLQIHKLNLLSTEGKCKTFDVSGMFLYNTN